MNRNTNAHFSELPSADIPRSTFDRSFSHKLSGNTGDIIPIFYDEILPGDTVSMDTSKVVRFQTLLTPMMDNLYCDIYWFFVPNRLVWDHWINFMGENTESAWLPPFSIPFLPSRFPNRPQARRHPTTTRLAQSLTILASRCYVRSDRRYRGQRPSHPRLLQNHERLVPFRKSHGSYQSLHRRRFHHRQHRLHA